MFAWLAANFGWLLVLAALVGIVTLIVVRMIKDRRAGKSSCGGNCAGCAGCCYAAKCPSAQGQGPAEAHAGKHRSAEQ